MVRRIGTQALVDVAGPDGATVPRPVRTGIVGDELTQIVEGVQEGDQVVAPAPIAATAAGLGEDSVTFSAGPPNGVQAIPAGPGQMIFRKSP
jgi:hypothetical protein